MLQLLNRRVQSQPVTTQLNLQSKRAHAGDVHVIRSEVVFPRVGVGHRGWTGAIMLRPAGCQRLAGGENKADSLWTCTAHLSAALFAVPLMQICHQHVNSWGKHLRMGCSYVALFGMYARHSHHLRFCCDCYFHQNYFLFTSIFSELVKWLCWLFELFWIRDCLKAKNLYF